MLSGPKSGHTNRGAETAAPVYFTGRVLYNGRTNGKEGPLFEFTC